MATFYIVVQKQYELLSQGYFLGFFYLLSSCGYILGHHI